VRAGPREPEVYAWPGPAAFEMARDSSATGSTPAATMVSAGKAASPRRSSLAIWYAITASVSKLNGRSTSVAGSFLHHVDEDQQRGGEHRRPQDRQVHATKVSNGLLPRLRALASIAGVMRASPASTDW